MDLAIDQGGNAASSRPIYGPHEAWVESGVIHFAMPNLASLVARTSSKVFSATINPWLLGAASGDESMLAKLRAAEIVSPGVAGRQA